MKDVRLPTSAEAIALLPKSISQDLDDAQDLADQYNPILGQDLSDIFNMIKLKLSIIKESNLSE